MFHSRTFPLCSLAPGVRLSRVLRGTTEGVWIPLGWNYKGEECWTASHVPPAIPKTSQAEAMGVAVREGLSTAPVFWLGFWASLCAYPLSRKTTNKGRKSSYKEIRQICFKIFKITLSVLTLQEIGTFWKGHAYTHQLVCGVVIA